MLKMFCNLLPKLSEIGKTVKQHSQINFIKNSLFQFWKLVTIIILNRSSSYKIAGFSFTEKVNLDRNGTFLLNLKKISNHS